MRVQIANDPSLLRSKAEFFQRLARGLRTTEIREKLVELSCSSMDEAAALEKRLNCSGESNYHPQARFLTLVGKDRFKSD